MEGGVRSGSLSAARAAERAGFGHLEHSGRSHRAYPIASPLPAQSGISPLSVSGPTCKAMIIYPIERAHLRATEIWQDAASDPFGSVRGSPGLMGAGSRR